MLGDKLKQLRKDRKLSQKKLGEILNLSQSAIGMIEGNKNGASSEKLREIADFFGVTVDYLLSDDKENIKVENVEISKKAEKDIKKALDNTLEQLENYQDGLMFDGEPIDDETRELLKVSLENSMRLAKQIAKVKYTPNKYKDKK